MTDAATDRVLALLEELCGVPDQATERAIARPPTKTPAMSAQPSSRPH